MFPEQFSAWKYGPVMVSIRQGFKQGKMQDMPSEEEIVAYQMVFDSIFKQYAPKSSMSLSTLSHGEYSWRHARGESMPDGHCDALLDDSCHFGKFQCHVPLPFDLDLSAVINAHKLD